jgi:thiol-disulfide isomerase/thioredoxin
MRSAPIILLFLLLSTACTQQEQSKMQEEIEMLTHQSSEGPMVDNRGQKEDPMVMGVYHDYTVSGLPKSVLTDGTTKVLFFHAAWCPACKLADEYVHKELLNGRFKGEALRSIYKLDYDREGALKDRYGVVYQHTFVKVDGEGNMLASVQGPTNEELYQFVAQ